MNELSKCVRGNCDAFAVHNTISISIEHSTRKKNPKNQMCALYAFLVRMDVVYNS